MGFLMPFIVLIERRLLRPLTLVLLSSLALVAGLGVHAGSKPKIQKTAKDLQAAIAAPLLAGDKWVKDSNGQRFVDAVVVSNSSDPTMQDLRRAVLALGGTVNGRFNTVRALSVTLPAKAVKLLDERSDVESISPNRATRKAASALEFVTGASTAQVRSATGAPPGWRRRRS